MATGAGGFASEYWAAVQQFRVESQQKHSASQWVPHVAARHPTMIGADKRVAGALLPRESFGNPTLDR